MLEVDGPAALGDEVVLLGLDAVAVGEGRVEREAGARDEDVLARVGHGRDAQVQGAGAARAQDHVVVAVGEVIRVVKQNSGWQFSRIFWPEKRLQYRPKNWCGMTFEKDICTNYQNCPKNLL